MDEDMKILENQIKQPTLSNNVKNCIEFMYTEKKVLSFMKECATSLVTLMTMTAWDARKLVRKWV